MPDASSVVGLGVNAATALFDFGPLHFGVSGEPISNQLLERNERVQFMQIQNEEIMKRLEKLAYQKSYPFCYSCYKRAPSGVCEICGGDDCMRELAGEGVEFGSLWIIESLVRNNLTAINVDEEFEASVRGCYDETVKVLWMELDAVTVAKESDPISWRIARDEWIDNELNDELLIEIDSKYYRTSDVEEYLDGELSE